MSKRLLKKVFTAVLCIAMVLNLYAVPAFAEDEIKVEFVYTNVTKLTMATGTTRQIKTYTVPENATNQEMRFSSSDKNVARVSADGVVTAVSPGIATITVKARDGSKAQETITVNVVKNLIINKDNVDSDGEVIVFDETYGNVSIDSSVGSADIYLSGVTVMNKLLLEKGSYNVYMYESSAESIEVVESFDDIVSFSTEEDNDIPGLHIYDTSSINNISAGSGLNLTQDDTSEINTLVIDYDGEGDINIDLEGFSGNVIINTTGSGSINLNLTGSSIANVIVTGGANSGTVVFNNVEGSQITDLTVNGSSNISLQTPAENVSIGSDSDGSSLELGANVKNLNNSGANSNITINSQVGNLVSTGTGNITLNEGAEVKNQELGTGTKVKDNTPVYAGGGGIGGGTASQPIEIEPGAVIIDEDFEDGIIDNKISGRGLISKMISADGNNSDKCMLVSGRTESYYGMTIDLLPYTVKYAGKHVTLVFSADVKYTEGDDTTQFKFTADDGQYTNVALVTANKGQWATLTGTYTVLGTKTYVYLEGNGTGNYYVDNLHVSIQSVSDLVYVDSITLDQSSAVIGIGGQFKFNAEVLPANAEDTSVTWFSSDPSIASVDTTGLVTAYKGGTVTITAESNGSGKKAYATVTVDPTIKVYSVRTDKSILIFTETGGTEQLGASVTLNASPYTSAITWTSGDSSIASVSDTGLVTAVADGSTTITASTVIDVDGTPTTFSADCRVEVDTNALYVNTYDDPDAPIGFTPMGNAQLIYENGYVKAYGRSNGYEGGALSTSSYNGKEIRITADVKHGNASPTNVIITYNTGSTYTRVVDSGNIPVGEWMTITGTVYVNNANSKIYFESSNTTCDLYYDNIIISEIIQLPTPITGVTLSNNTLEMNVGQERTLTATIEPERATTSRELTWTTSDSSVATVDADGKVTAVGVGTAAITVTTTVDGVSTVAYSDTCTVTVSPALANPADPVVVDFENMAVGTTLSWIGWGGDDGVATVITDPNNPANKLLEVKPAGYARAAIIDLTIPQGNTLYDYGKISFKALWKEGDVGWKDVEVEAAQTLTGRFHEDDQSAARRIASYNRAAGATAALEETELDLNGNQSDLSGDIQIAIGIHCDGTAVYYLDDITLIPKVPRSVTPVETIVMQSGFEEALLVNNSGTSFAVTRDAARTGQGCLLVSNADQDWKGPEFTLTEAGTYNVSAYVRTVSGSSIEYAFMDTTSYSEYNSRRTNSDTEWTQLQATVSVASGSAITLRICAKTAGGGNVVSYYIDDLVVTSNSATVMQSGFEETLLVNNSSTNFTYVTTDKRSGNRSMYVSNADANWKGPEFTISEAGDYTLTAYVKSDSGSQEFCFKDTTSYQAHGTQTNNGSEWTQITAAVTVPEGGMTFRINCPGASETNIVSYFIDDFKVTQ